MARQLDQLQVPEPPESPRPTDNLFLGIFPDAGTAARLTGLANRLKAAYQVRGKSLAPERFHVSLYFLGSYYGLPEQIVRAARIIAATVAVATPWFQIRFDHVGSFSGRHGHQPLVLRDDGHNAPLMKFQHHLVTVLHAWGIHSRGDERFTPHLTLLYGDALPAEITIEPISWVVDEFVLVHSLLGKSRYLPLARWSLHDPAT